MRFDRLELLRWGALADVTLDLSEGERGLHVVYGDNEAGKSTTRRAISALLFGIPVQSSDGFRFDYRALRLGATLRFEDGTRLTFRRKKGQKATVLSLEDAPISDAPLVAALAGISRDTFDREWSLDHERLREGGAALLRGEGELGQSLLAAGLGGIGVGALQAELVEEARALFGRRTSRIAMLREQVQEQRKAREAHGVLLAQVLARRAELYGLEERRGAAEATAKDLAAEVALLAQLDAARSESARADAEAAEHRARLATIAVDAPALAAAEAIDVLEAGLPLHVHREAQRAAWGAERERHASALALAATTVGVDVAALAARPDKPYAALEDEARALAAEGAMRRAERGALIAVQQAEDAALETLEAAAKDLGPPDPAEAALAAALEAIRDVRASGDVAETLAARRLDLSRATSEAKSAFDALPRWSRGPLGRRALETARLPTEAEILACAEAHDTRVASEAARTAESAALKDDKRALRVIASLTGEQVPTEASLERARARRDLGLALVRAALEGTPAESSAVRAFAGEAPLGAAFERALLEADAVADRLRSDADRAARLASAERERTAIAARLRSAREALAKGDAAREEAHARLVALFRPLGVDAGSPEEMRAWLGDAERVRGLFRAEERARAALGDLTGRLRAGLAPVAKLLGASEVKDHDLGRAWRDVEARAAAASAMAKKRDDILRELKGARERADERRARDAAAATREEAWARAWEAFAARAGIEGGSAHVVAVLEAVVRAISGTDRIADLTTSLDAARLASDAYLADVRAACAVAGGGPDGDVGATVHALASRLRAAREAQQKRTTEAARVSDAERRVADASRRVGDAEIALATAGDARDLAERRADLARRSADADATIKELSQAIGALENELAKVTGGADAAEDESTLQGLIAAIGDTSAEFLRLSFAASMLRQAAERYRAVHQSPLLAHASELFRQLTLGSFVAVRVDDEDEGRDKDRAGRGVLKGVRGDGELVSASGMSDGTRDQLFLALRLAALETQLARREPLPFVVDDLLIHLSDDRARATLEALADLSRRTQVLLFTHHVRIVELARGLSGRDVFIHALGPARAPST